jgi:cell division septation protein DedD
MDVTLDPRASRLLALMHEADTEAVTLDELEIAGVEDPARALHALELAGFTFERVTDRTATRETVECVRLARVEAAAAAATAGVDATVVEQPTVEWEAPSEPAPTPAPTAQKSSPPRLSREAEAFAAARAPRRADQLLEAADRRPLLLALIALVLVAVLGRAVVGRRG